MAWTDLHFGLLSLLRDNSLDLMRLFIAVGLTLISWNLTHKLLGPLDRTNGLHTLLGLLQLIFVCLFLFFAIADTTLVSTSSPVDQSAPYMSPTPRSTQNTRRSFRPKRRPIRKCENVAHAIAICSPWFKSEERSKHSRNRLADWVCPSPRPLWITDRSGES